MTDIRLLPRCSLHHDGLTHRGERRADQRWLVLTPVGTLTRPGLSLGLTRRPEEDEKGSQIRDHPQPCYLKSACGKAASE